MVVLKLALKIALCIIWMAKNYASNGQIAIHKAAGCKQCNNSGYKCRLSLHELMAVSADVRRLIQTHAPLQALQKTALNAAMRTLEQDGIIGVLQGLTDMTQVRAVCA